MNYIINICLLFLKETLGSSTRVKQFCKYYKELKKLEVIPFNQTTNKTVTFF